MKRDCFKLSILLLMVITFYFILWISAEVGDDTTWMDPDAWDRDHLISDSLQSSGKCCKCYEHSNGEEPLKQQQNFADDTASLMYFKRFVAMLFNRKNFKYDSTQQIYQRSIVFTVESYQMDKLERLQDPRDLDSIVTEIFNNIQQSHAAVSSNKFTTTVFNIFYDVLELIKMSEIRFILIVVIVILIAWIFNTRFNIGWIPLIFGGIFIYGYLHTYLECNRELEVNQMLEILNLDNESEKNAKGYNILNYIKGIFYSAEVQRLQQQKIKHSAKLSLGFCRPDHVLIMYFNDIFLKYLEVLVEQCTITLTTLNGALGFPYNMLSGFLLICLIGYIIKLTFKYIFSPLAWAQCLYRNQLHKPDYQAIKSTTNSQDDRISGDNLKLFLKAINTVPLSVDKIPTAVSGVEDVKEAVESKSEKCLQLDKRAAPENGDNLKKNVANKKVVVAKTEGLLENS